MGDAKRVRVVPAVAAARGPAAEVTTLPLALRAAPSPVPHYDAAPTRRVWQSPQRVSHAASLLATPRGHGDRAPRAPA
jgi:hypothetical protein